MCLKMHSISLDDSGSITIVLTRAASLPLDPAHSSGRGWMEPVLFTNGGQNGVDVVGTGQ